MEERLALRLVLDDPRVDCQRTGNLVLAGDSQRPAPPILEQIGIRAGQKALRILLERIVLEKMNQQKARVDPLVGLHPVG